MEWYEVGLGLLVTSFAVAILIWGILKPGDIPDREEAVKMGLVQIAATVAPIALIGLVITVAIYAGIATPTEAAAVAALLTVILAFGVGGLKWQGFTDALFATMRTMGYLGLLLSAGALFGFVLTYFRVPQQFTDLFLSFDLSPYVVLMIVLIFYIVLGMFFEPVSMTFITLPTIFPLMAAAGFDLIWFGVACTASAVPSRAVSLIRVGRVAARARSPRLSSATSRPSVMMAMRSVRASSSVSAWLTIRSAVPFAAISPITM